MSDGHSGPHPDHLPSSRPGCGAPLCAGDCERRTQSRPVFRLVPQGLEVTKARRTRPDHLHPIILDRFAWNGAPCWDECESADLQSATAGKVETVHEPAGSAAAGHSLRRVGCEYSPRRPPSTAVPARFLRSDFGSDRFFDGKGATEIVNLPSDGKQATYCRVRQVRQLILRHKLGEEG